MSERIKHGGRKKGTPNRLTKELRISLKNVIHEELQQLQNQLKSLDPKDRLDILIKLMPYALPKINTVNSTIDEPINIEW
ncbi:hypothetical protein [Labilibaculum sp.]|uniref:hypothetical protein n=1 Tax=Labilibaculum sp. TaxID=2060723 RepID=UPI003565DC3F